MKRCKTILSVLLIALSTIMLLSGCSKPRVYKIGISQCSQDDWRNKMNEEIDREIMFHEDAVVEIRSANDSNEKQIADIKYFMEHDFDILIVSPNEAAALTPVIKEVYEKKMPVIIFDRNIKGDTYTARIGVDNTGLGRSAARYALNMLGNNARAIEIYGRPGSTPAEDRHEGFASEFTAAGGHLLASVPGNWNKEGAISVADSLLRIYDDVDLIYAHNDRMAIGASEVARRLGRSEIKIIGIDAAPDIGIRAVADSVIDATFLYPTEGHRLIRTALAILKGEPYDREQILPLSSAVDLTNADVLLLQNGTLKEETDKMKILKAKVDDYWAQHSSQTSLFYASIAIIALLFGVVFLILRAYWQHRRHQYILVKQNRELEQQRDMQRSLNEKLQAATQSKLMFFTNVSHDLRTPLTLIAEPVAQLAAAGNLTPQQHTLLKIADKNVRILRRLINQILDFRKFENDKLHLQYTETDLGAALAEWMEAFASVAVKRHIRLTLSEADAHESFTLALDAEKIERVFFNLVSNALKYTPDNGAITVSYARCGDMVSVSVADTGEGISHADIGSIFDRFYQVDRVRPEGSGIGLSLCKAFVELHGGTLSVRSEPGKGSVFTFTLPVRHVAPQASAAVPGMTSREVEAELDVIDAEETFGEDRPLVLVIDDNGDMRQLLASLLGTDYNVIAASNALAGLKKARKYVPDLIICDVMMPGMDGMECCRRLKDEVSTSHIPVLMLTACSMDEQRAQGYASGADGYLSKPFGNAVLKARCASLVDNRKRISELLRRPGAPAEQKNRQEIKPQGGDIDNDFYNRFLEIIEQEMGNSSLVIDAIASKMGLERTQFYRKIKSLTNFSPVELIRKIRLDKGRRLLLSTDRSISEIAYETGFSTPAYFTRCYRENFGETPTETRSKH